MGTALHGQTITHSRRAARSHRFKPIRLLLAKPPGCNLLSQDNTMMTACRHQFKPNSAATCNVYCNNPLDNADKHSQQIAATGRCTMGSVWPMSYLAHASRVSAVATSCPKHLARIGRRRACDNPYGCLHQPFMPPPYQRPVDSRRLQTHSAPPPEVGCSGDRRPVTEPLSCGSSLRSVGARPQTPISACSRSPILHCTHANCLVSSHAHPTNAQILHVDQNN